MEGSKKFNKNWPIAQSDEMEITDLG